MGIIIRYVSLLVFDIIFLLDNNLILSIYAEDVAGCKIMKTCWYFQMNLENSSESKPTVTNFIKAIDYLSSSVVEKAMIKHKQILL